MLSRLVITFLPRSECFLISWLQSPFAVILEPQNKSQPLIPYLFAMKWWERMLWALFSECWVLSQHFTFSLSSRGSLVLLHFLPYEWCHLHIFSSVQFSHSVVSNSVTPWTTARQASLSITNRRSPPKLMAIKSVMPSNHLILLGYWYFSWQSWFQLVLHPAQHFSWYALHLS